MFEMTASIARTAPHPCVARKGIRRSGALVRGPQELGEFVVDLVDR